MRNGINLQDLWPKEWTFLLSESALVDALKTISHSIEKENQKITPEPSKIFAALEACPPEKVKVVILGQDPYPTEGHANGLAFSANRLVRPIPKSLKNIFSEIERDFKENLALRSPDLSAWAKQGVLLLNTQLTTIVGQADAHKDLPWSTVVDIILKTIAKNETLCVMLWGKKASAKKDLFKPEKHLLLEAPHPSPLSAYRGFIGCGHFSKCNAYLKKKNLSPISWVED